MKKVVVELCVHDNKAMKKAKEAVTTLLGIEKISLGENKLTVIGTVDPVDIVKKLEKWHAKLVTVGPAEEKKD